MKITIKWRSTKEREAGGRLLKSVRMTGGIIKSFETRRLRTCSWRRKGDNSRAREKRRKTNLFKQTLKVMFHIIKSL